MGQEASCTATYRGRSSSGTAHLEPDALTFRGEFRLAIPLKDVAEVEAKRGRLVVRFAGGEAALELGAAAEPWALKIRYPRSLIDKLGVKPTSKVAFLGVPDAALREELDARCADVSERLRRDLDIVLFYAASREDLAKLARLESHIRRDGMIWVIYPKGAGRPIGQIDVFAATKAAGLVDVKICSVSDALSGVKVVIPRERR